MKFVIIIGFWLLVGLGFAQAIISSDMSNTEQQPYEVVWQEGILEARFYPKAVMATVHGESSDYKTSSNRSFRVLAGYIFGGNERKQSIAMTSPVHMSFSKSGSVMSFVMPSNMGLEDLPAPNSEGLEFKEVQEKYVVALQFGGWANDDNISANATKLVNALSEMGIQIDNEPWFMGYNPPYQLINRRNEVAVEISKEQLKRLTGTSRS